ncbi:MAG: threonine/serine exporter family protein [Fusobacteria bacterium]|nr:threonine/serine exporter family protein [Fusobacteriota bacterium]
MDKNNQQLSEKEKFEKACKFVIRLGTLAHQYGTQSKSLDTFLAQVIKTLGYSGIFKSTPTEISFTFKEEQELWHKTHLVTFSGPGFNLAKMAKLDTLVAKVIKGTVSLNIAIEMLEKIDKLKPPFNKYLVAFGYAIAGAGYAGYLQCSIYDIILSAILSVVVFLIVETSAHFSERFELSTTVLSAFVAGTIAALCSIILPSLQVYLITLSAIIYLIPGFTISNGVIELTYKYVVSGLTNIVNGVFYLVLLFCGAWVGISMVYSIFPVHQTAEGHIPLIFIWPSIMVLVVGLCIIFQTSPKDFIWAIIGCLITCCGIILGIHMGNIDLGNFLGTVFAVIFANIWSSKTHRAASIVLLPAIVLLVSGSIGFRGFVSYTSGNTVLGQQQFTHMFVVAATIAMGLILGNSLTKPKTTL